MKSNWQSIKPDDVTKAIDLFEKANEPYPEAKHTFLVYNNKKYPAKHIRGLAYRVANKREIPKTEYSGGMETVIFFTQRGFLVEYKGQLISSEDIKTISATRQSETTHRRLQKPESPKAHTKEHQRTQGDSITKHKIARIVVTVREYNKDGSPNYKRLYKVIEKFIAENHNLKRFEFIVTPGGFLQFQIPPDLIPPNIEIEYIEKSHTPLMQTLASQAVNAFFAGLNKQVIDKLSETADYMSVGIDGMCQSNGIRIELVAVFDLKRAEAVSWSGKFYPLESQKRNLIKITDLSTHFIELNNQKIAIVGCHDLNVFSARGQAAAKPGGKRRRKAAEFKRMCKAFQPTIFLHHPHYTFSPKIWMVAWGGLIRALPSVLHYASGIRYQKMRDSDTMRPLEKVLAATRQGDVEDFYFFNPSKML